MAKAAERAEPSASVAALVESMLSRISMPEIKPVVSPLPRAKPAPEPDVAALPKRTVEETPEPGVIAQCGMATIRSVMDKVEETLVYRASFAPDMADRMVEEGCGQFYRGCNICTVRYKGCGEEEKAACTGTDCLEKTCEREVICSTKTCQIQGKAPTCESRLVRTSCRRKLFP